MSNNSSPQGLQNGTVTFTTAALAAATTYLAGPIAGAGTVILFTAASLLLKRMAGHAVGSTETPPDFRISASDLAHLGAPNTPPGAILLVEVPQYPGLTASYGLSWSNRLMDAVAEQLRQTLATADRMVPLNGGQILITLEDKARANGLAADMVQQLAQPLACDGVQTDIDICVGVVTDSGDGEDWQALCQRALLALDSARLQSDRIAAFDPDQAIKVAHNLDIAQRLQTAIIEGNLELHYQPVLDLVRNRVTQVEALSRWPDGEAGYLNPAEFIPLAEQSGNILALSDRVLAEAARVAAHWQRMGIDIQVSINVSAREFLKPEFVERVLDRVDDVGIKPETIALQLKESATISDIGRAAEHLHALRDAGFRLALDNVGLESSSLIQLKQLPMHELKIDRSLIVGLDTHADNHKLVRSTIEMGHNLGLNVIAEGVENHTILLLLKQMGCDAVQGYQLGKPLSQTEFEQWWQDHDAHVAQALSLEAPPSGVAAFARSPT